MTLRDALHEYRVRVSIHKKGYAQECYRIERIASSALCSDGRLARDVTSVEIATYRDSRLQDLNHKTGKPISPATVRLELSLLSNLFEIGRIEWGICDDNPVLKVRKPKSSPGRERRLAAREERQILKFAFNHANPELYSIIVLAIETAMRQGEILNLTWDNIKLKPGIAILPDTKNGTCWMKIKFHPKRPVFPGLQRCRTSLKYHPFRYQCLADSSFLHADGCSIGERMKLYLYGHFIFIPQYSTRRAAFTKGQGGADPTWRKGERTCLQLQVVGTEIHLAVHARLTPHPGLANQFGRQTFANNPRLVVDSERRLKSEGKV